MQNVIDLLQKDFMNQINSLLNDRDSRKHGNLDPLDDP